MKIRTVRIWLSRGWYRIVCSVSLLLLPLLCGKSDVFAAMYPAQQEAGDTVSVKKGDVITGVVRKKDGTPFPGVKISQSFHNIMPGVSLSPNEGNYRPVAVTDENGAYSITVNDPKECFYFYYPNYVIEYFYLNRKNHDVILFDKSSDFDKEYGTNETSAKKKLQDKTAPGMVIMTAYGTPRWKGASGIDIEIVRDTTLSRLTQEMMEKVRAYELEQEQKNKK
ncbi:MAG: carboxypeptidase regulatory-like domain-containing protein [Bacteroidaceae bacterium]|nr:carboxypeptidase regulatory-like domain-containing protein [Bacteroidaceae bacterium]